MLPPITVALHTGMRLGEIVNLRPSDLDFNSKTLLVRDSKNGEPRHVPMDSAVHALLSTVVQDSQQEFVFYSRRSDGRYVEIRKAFRDARERAALVDLKFHDLRHTFASHFMMAGGAPRILPGGPIRLRAKEKKKKKKSPKRG